jgi:hypothetical protein
LSVITYPDALAVKEGQCALEERHGVGIACGRTQLGVHQPAGEIDRDVQVAPADAVPAGIAASSPLAPTAAVQAA